MHGKAASRILNSLATTRPSTLSVNRCRQSSACVSNDTDQFAKVFLIGALIMELSSGTTAITDVAARKLTIRKRLIRGVGGPHCSSKPLARQFSNLWNSIGYANVYPFHFFIFAISEAK